MLQHLHTRETSNEVKQEKEEDQVELIWRVNATFNTKFEQLGSESLPLVCALQRDTSRFSSFISLVLSESDFLSQAEVKLSVEREDERLHRALAGHGGLVLKGRKIETVSSKDYASWCALLDTISWGRHIVGQAHGVISVKKRGDGPFNGVERTVSSSVAVSAALKSFHGEQHTASGKSWLVRAPLALPGLAPSSELSMAVRVNGIFVAF